MRDKCNWFYGGIFFLNGIFFNIVNYLNNFVFGCIVFLFEEFELYIYYNVIKCGDKLGFW